MSSEKRMIEEMLFNYDTTNKADFRYGKIYGPTKTVYKEKAKPESPKYKQLKDTHTLTDWKLESIPFYLLHKPKDIVQTNPHNVQQRYELESDKEKDEVRATRPRIVMTPAVSMDDIKNPETRRILCEDMYISNMARANKEVEAEYLCVRAPFTGRPAPSNPMKYPELRQPYVSPEWRMETVSWDGKQLRAHCDPTKEFWLKRKPPSCRMCDETAIVKDYRRLKKGRQ